MNTRLLRLVLTADAAIGGVAALALIAGSGFVAAHTDIPGGLLLGVGLALVPLVAFLAWTASRPAIPGWAVHTIVEINAIWAIGSFALLATGALQPNALGVAFIAAQALMVLGLGLAQWIALRQPVRAIA